MTAPVTPAAHTPADRGEGINYRPPSGVALIAFERQRQIDVEGFNREGDTRYVADELARAAACYALPDKRRRYRRFEDRRWPREFPWLSNWWKPTPDDRVRELVKAGALIAAEIDRLQAGTR